MAVIASILGILLFIMIEVLPLMGRADVTPGRAWSWNPVLPGAFLTNEHRTRLAFLTPEGDLVVLDSESGGTLQRYPLIDGATESAALPLQPANGTPGQQVLYAATADGRVFAVRVDWIVEFDEDRRTVRAEPRDGVFFPLELDGASVVRHSVQISDDDAAGALAATSDGRLLLLRREVEENLFSGEVEERWSRMEAPLRGTVSSLVIDGDLRNAFVGTDDGALEWWRIRGSALESASRSEPGSPVTSLSMLIGDRSLVVGRDDGALEIWFPVQPDGEPAELTRIRDFPSLPGSINAITPSMRNKGFVAADTGGEIGLYYSTSARVLWRGEAAPAPQRLLLTPKADALLASDSGGVREWEIHNPHPEVSLRSLFGKIWYESYPEPAYVWQSSGGSDDFEPKLSLVPLMLGTLKGTLYSLILAVPLGVFGAMYTSQFMHPSLKKVVKPSVEVMAALPSVVLGFMAGLWLAPRVETILPGLVLMALLVPLAVLVAGVAWRALPLSIRGHFRAGSETLVYMVVISLAMFVSLRLSAPFEQFFFDGSVQQWLLKATGMQYDQRNAVVVGLAMGFAVIPIIFSIAEDAFSNVPNNLISGSLALGANRWQTVTRVVLPTASPGIFSGIMIGFGRAVGETMIVLMATGNTPILDWSPFNGFRTLSANIAVEIPEAPQGGTLYRTLFLAAVILFVFTFVINTGAELIRQRLRRRYAEL
jgi:phosphate transport system permease protein